MSGNNKDMDGNQPVTSIDLQPLSETPQETAPNGNSTTAENASDKKKGNKPGNITIMENGDQEENNIRSPLSPLRSYGGMQATELLLLISPPAEESPPVTSSSKHKMSPSDDHEPQDDISSSPPDVENEIFQNEAPVPLQKDECEVTEDVILEEKPCEDEVDPESKTKEAEMENGIQERDLHGSDQVEREVLTFQNTALSVPEVPESEYVEQTAIKVDDDGVSSEEVLPKLTERQQMARDAILNELQAELVKLLESDDEDEKYKDSCCRRCTDDCCLQSCTCIFGNPFSRGDRKGTLKKKEPILTETLRKGRAEGLSDFKKAIFPLIPDLLRMVWVIFELAIVIVGLVLSVVSLSLNQNRVFNIIHLVLINISTLLALVDGIFTLKNSKTCRKLCSKCKADPNNSNKEDKNETEEGCCGKCYSHCSNTFDIMRLILSEVIFYPLLCL